MTDHQSDDHDHRIERVLRAVPRWMTPPAESEILQGLLRQAWELMSTEARDAFMVSAPTRETLSDAPDALDHGHLRAMLTNVGGAARVVITVEHRPDGGELSVPRGSPLALKVTSIALQRAEDLGTSNARMPYRNEEALLGRLAIRISEDTADAFPKDADVPAWTSTIEWDLTRDVLTESFELPQFPDHRFKAKRWIDASEALDRGHRGTSVSVEGERFIVLEIQPALGRVPGPLWVEIALTPETLGALTREKPIALGNAQAPIWSGGGSGAALTFAQIVASQRAANWPRGEEIAFRANGEGAELVMSGVISRALVEEAMLEPDLGPIFFRRDGSRAMEPADAESYERHLAWVADYLRCRGGAQDEESEFDTAAQREVP